MLSNICSVNVLCCAVICVFLSILQGMPFRIYLLTFSLSALSFSCSTLIQFADRRDVVVCGWGEARGSLKFSAHSLGYE